MVLFNRFYQPDIDLDTEMVTPNLQLSDSAELRLRLRWVAMLYGQVQVDMAITGACIRPRMRSSACLPVPTWRWLHRPVAQWHSISAHHSRRHGTSGWMSVSMINRRPNSRQTQPTARFQSVCLRACQLLHASSPILPLTIRSPAGS